jgi:hypothetical protein
MTTNVRIGLAFDLNGNAIALQPKEAINEIATKGIELTLPEPVPLGEAGIGIDSILESLGSDYRAVALTKTGSEYTLKDGSTTEQGKDYIYKSVDNLDITVLTSVYQKVMKAQLAVEKFHVKIPGSEAKQANSAIETTYTIGLSATWPKSDEDKLSGLTLTGIYFEVSNE